MVYQIISCLQPISARRRPGLLLRTNYSDPIFIGNDWLPQRDPPKLLTLGETLGFACDHPVQLGKLDGVVDQRSEEVLGRGYGVKVAGESQVDALEGLEPRVRRPDLAARRSARRSYTHRRAFLVFFLPFIV